MSKDTKEQLETLTDMWYALEASKEALIKQEAAYMKALKYFNNNVVFDWICPTDGHVFSGGCRVFAHNTCGALNVPPITNGKVTCPECGMVQTVEEAQAVKDLVHETMKSEGYKNRNKVKEDD